MKRILSVLLMMGAGAALYAQSTVPDYQAAAGKWTLKDGRLYQTDFHSGLAKANVKVPQKGPMVYDFNVRCEGGIQDGQGGFGLHLFTNSVSGGRTWGSGKSYLLWLNYDEKPATADIPRGLSGQVYRSVSDTRMDLALSVDLNRYRPYLTEAVLAEPVSFRVWVNGDTGEVRVYDPTDPDYRQYYYFYIDKADLPLKGDWVVLRTNGMSASFGPGLLLEE